MLLGVAKEEFLSYFHSSWQLGHSIQLVEVNLNMILFAGSSLVYGWVVSGPIQITLSILGVIGNILSIIVFTRPTMKSDINFILIGKYTYKVQLF